MFLKNLYERYQGLGWKLGAPSASAGRLVKVDRTFTRRVFENLYENYQGLARNLWGTKRRTSRAEATLTGRLPDTFLKTCTRLIKDLKGNVWVLALQPADFLPLDRTAPQLGVCLIY
jgi:hypothetical protein